MKKLLLIKTLVAVLCINHAYGSTINDVLTGTPCSSQLKQQLIDWEVTGDIFLSPAGNDIEMLYRLPTKVIGTWVLLQVSKSQPLASLVSEAGAVQFQWDEKCEPHTYITGDSIAHTTQGFTDTDLKELLSRNKQGIIYLWSPHMLLSVAGVGELKTISEELGVAYTVLLDPNADIGFAQRTIEQAGLPMESLNRAASRELLFRDMYIHAPTLLLYGDGNIVGAVVPGYRHPEHYRQTIRDRLKLDNPRHEYE